MSMTGLTPEQRRLVEQAGDQPVRIEDPEMHRHTFSSVPIYTSGSAT